MRPQRYRAAMTGSHRFSVLAVALIAAGALASILATPTYVSSTRLFVSVQSAE